MIGAALQLGGMPVPRGGGVALVDALAAIVREAGGELRTEAKVERVLVSDGRATAVRLVDGEVIGAERAIVAGVTPTQLYGRLLAAGTRRAGARGGGPLPLRASPGCRSISRSRSRRAWRGDERLGRTAIVHVTPGLDGVSRAVNEASGACSRPRRRSSAASRWPSTPPAAPADAWMLWIQLQELPQRPVEATRPVSSTSATGPGREELREAYADRIVERLARHLENVESAALGRVVLSPADLASLNVNLGARRHLRGLVRARPEPALAAAAPGARARERRSTVSFTSAPAPIPARASGQAPGISWRRS